MNIAKFKYVPSHKEISPLRFVIKYFRGKSTTGLPKINQKMDRNMISH